LIPNPQQGILALVWMFIRQVGIGLALGILFGKERCCCSTACA
jgi:hypothetical protein